MGEIGGRQKKKIYVGGFISEKKISDQKSNKHSYHPCIHVQIVE